MRIIHFYALLLLAALLQGCSKDDNVRVRDNNILPSVITDNFNLKTFSAALDRSNLTSAVSAEGPFTALVPSDAAFQAGGYNGPGAIIAASQPVIKKLTAYHILEGMYQLERMPFLFNQEIASYGGGKLYFTRWVKGNDTIMTVNGSRITPQAVKASNGLVQVIDRVLQPYSFGQLADAIAAENELTLFYQALRRAGMEELLRGKGPFTVYAPDNNAMAAYGLVSLEEVNNTNPVALQALLRYHIVADRRFLNDYVLSTGASAESTQAMLDNNTVKITLVPNSSVQGGYDGITLRGPGNVNTEVKVTRRDIVTGNGILHITDQVLRINQ